ncbi:MAG: TonB-dependent receptor plug domain-containing protein [Flavobacteriaceae bacterium]|nr:TonB-dependent receptor plug domain-containing protein [Flavobacteriaceae bacterium]
MNKFLSICIVYCCFSLNMWGQNAQIKGVILDKFDVPIPQVKVSVAQHNTLTDKNGFYLLEIVNTEEEIKIFYNKSNYIEATVSTTLVPNQVKEINLLLLPQQSQLDEIFIQKGYENLTSAIVIPSTILRQIPGANAGVENLLKTLPGVNSNNELSTQYAVRGGNYDENLVYINGVEIYRPFLIRSGQQEGLSFINSQMVENIHFSAGGFQAKYGDKLSSVLDIQYRNPLRNKTSIEGSFLGLAGTVDLVSKDQKWSAITGIRYRNNRLLVNKQETNSTYNPSFVDMQTVVNFRPSKQWNFSFLGNITGNLYKFSPKSRQTRFGTIDNTATLNILYQGNEEDKYSSLFGAIEANYLIDDQNKISWTVSAYESREQEYYDIEASYLLNTNKAPDATIAISPINDQATNTPKGIGSQWSHARNDYDALIISSNIKGTHKINDSQLEWGINYTHENIRDRMVEWEMVDSLGFTVVDPTLGLNRPDPYQPDEMPFAPYQNLRSKHFATINRLAAYTQWSKQYDMQDYNLFVHAGVRGQFWNINENSSSSNIAISPRAQIALKPYWEKDMLFRLSVGLYQQPPSYKEYRGMDGTLNMDLKAQKSLNVVLGYDYSFTIKKRPFKLQTELFYKNMTDVNTYTLDNVRIRYRADNNAIAYAYGIDMRFYGEFVPGTESWLSFGYLKTEENYDNKGYIARPTDQRLKFGLLFQDYMPQIPNLKMYLNLVYNTGVPGGSPAYDNPYLYQTRLNDYKRADAGFTYIFKDQKTGLNKSWLQGIEHLEFGFEIFNLFDNQNAITNTWVRDAYSKRQYAIPNYMTSRTFNVKINLTF